MKRLLMFLVVVVSAASAGTTKADVTLAQWTFETSMPTSGGPLTPEVGSGSAISNTGGTFSSPAGWGSTRSWSSNGWNVGEYFQFEVSTSGFQAINVSWQQTGSNTGPANFVFQYSVDGSNFTNFGTYGVTNDGWGSLATPAASVKSFDLTSISAVNDVTSVFFRLTMANTVAINGGTVASGGTGRVDNFTVSGTAVPEPTSLALLGVVGLGGLAARRFRKK